MEPEIIHHPDTATVKAAIIADDPLLLLVAHAGNKVLVAPADNVLEHVILLRLTGHKEIDLDRFYRVVLNRSGADWTFVCPEQYKGITDRERRIKLFYEEGFDIIQRALKLLGYDVPLTIPDRYRRHFKELSGN